jgi:hypothetical protein
VNEVLALRQRERSTSTGRSPLTILEAVQDAAWFGPCFGQDGDPVLVWKAPTWEMNPMVDRRVIEKAYANDAAAAAAEYGAEFRRDLAALG